MNELTYGQELVGMNFNPSGDDNVEKIKSLYAEVIDIMNSQEGISQKAKSIAITEAITAQMWAVKALFIDY